MKRILTFILTLLVTSTIVTVNYDFEVKATSNNGYYNFYCTTSQYEVSYITDDGNFEKYGCYSSFESATSVMYSLGDEYVVRHYNSPSPTMIIAMVSGRAYTYPARSGSTTMYIYEDLYDRSSSTKTTYVTNHYEMAYGGTELYFASGVGMIKVTLNGFEGYTDLEYTDLVPDKFIELGLPIYLGGNDNTSANEQPFKVTVRYNYYYVSDGDLKFVYHRSYSSSGGYDEEYTLTIGTAPDSFIEGVKYYSSNGYEFYTDPQETNYYDTYYSYYVYLPIRSQSNLTAAQLEAAFKQLSGASNSVLSGNAQVFIDAQETYGINALILYAMAAQESGWGTSTIARTKNNLFGWNAIDSNPSQASTFSSVEQSVTEHAGYNLRKYTDIYNPLFFGSHLGNKGSGFNVKYASDPYWGLKIAAICYSIDKTAGLVDYDNYEIAVVSEFNATFTDASGTTLYTSQYGPSYQECFTVIVLGQDGDKTIVQSPNPISNGYVYITYYGSGNGDGPVKLSDGLVEYDFDTSIAYISTSSLTFLDNSSSTNTGTSGTTSSLSGYNSTSINSISISDDTLSISGVAFTYGRNYNDDTTHDILLVDTSSGDVVKTVRATTISDYRNYNDSYNYDYIGFEVDIDIGDLANGSYYLMVSVDGYDAFLLVDVYMQEFGVDDYYVAVEQVQNNRIVLNVMHDKPDEVDLSSIYKPSQRASLNNNTFTLDEDELSISGNGWIFYVDFLEKSDVEYAIYLVSDEGTIALTMSEGTVDSDLVSLNNSIYSNSYENIFYGASLEYSSNLSGTYKAYIAIRNGQYYDYVPLTANMYEVSNDYFTVSVNSDGQVIVTIK